MVFDCLFFTYYVGYDIYSFWTLFYFTRYFLSLIIHSSVLLVQLYECCPSSVWVLSTGVEWPCVGTTARSLGSWMLVLRVWVCRRPCRVWMTGRELVAAACELKKHKSVCVIVRHLYIDFWSLSYNRSWNINYVSPRWLGRVNSRCWCFFMATELKIYVQIVYCI